MSPEDTIVVLGIIALIITVIAYTHYTVPVCKCICKTAPLIKDAITTKFNPIAW